MGEVKICPDCGKSVIGLHWHNNVLVDCPAVSNQFDGLVKRLRDTLYRGDPTYRTEAADAIEALQATISELLTENATLARALQIFDPGMNSLDRDK